MKPGFRTLISWASLLLAGAQAAQGAVAPVEIVTDRDAKPCRARYLYQPVAIYRDPSLFLGPFAAYVADPKRGTEELLKERPLLTKLTGNVALREVGDARPFHSFPIIQQMYGDLDRRFLSAETPKIVSFVLCGESGAYRDTLGFAIVSDLEQAERPAGGLPPSIEPNPVPNLGNGPSSTAKAPAPTPFTN